jgi:hypothetical protein
MKNKILKLRSEGKSYREICRILNCSKGTVAYHCGEGQKEKNRKRAQKNSGPHLIATKIESFCEKSSKTNIELRTKTRDFQRERVNEYNPVMKSKWHSLGKCEKTFGVKDVIGKFGRYTECYLTGEPIDLFEPKTYAFDHIVPPGKGGENTIDNLGIATRTANSAKSNMLLNEFIELCIKVLDHNGYEVKPKQIA